MDLYVLDSDLKRVSIVERFVSLIWTERYDSPGEFIFVIDADSYEYNLLKNNMFVELEDSDDIMTIESYSFNRSDNTLTVAGKSTVAYFGHRVLLPKNVSDKGGYISSGRIASIMRNIVSETSISGSNSSTYDKLPNLTLGRYSTDTSLVDVNIPIKTVLEALTEVASIDDLGFRNRKSFDDGVRSLNFDVYRGTDRSKSVIFSRDLNNFKDETHLKSMDGYKNHAYVIQDGIRTRSVSATSTVAKGWSRRVTALDLTDMSGVGWSFVDTRAKTELSKSKLQELNGGMIEDNVNPFKYGVNYRLGDTVTVDTPDSLPQSMRVSEIIRSFDEGSLEIYPTFRPRV